MVNKCRLNLISISLLLLLLVALPAFPEVKPLLRISIENTEDHIQTKYVMEFANLVTERSNGSINVEFYHSGNLYRDQEVISALYTGKVEMAVPGTWHVSSYVPEISYFLLPEFFGEEKQYNYDYLASEAGRQLIGKIEKDVNVVVPGIWMDLGHAVIFTTKGNKISSFQDLDGKTIRVAGGIMNKRRIELLGAKGVIISWSDISYHLRKGTIDGLLTTFETIKSSELWKDGIRYAFVDREYFPQYIPMISRLFWDKLSGEEQQIIIDTWNEVASRQRVAAEAAQIEAWKVAEQNGIVVTSCSADDLNSVKEKLLMHQQDLIDEIMND